MSDDMRTMCVCIKHYAMSRYRERNTMLDVWELKFDWTPLFMEI